MKNFQYNYNKEHPDHIWRHLLYKRTFYFFYNGVTFAVQLELVRFRYAGTNRTFTFYGDLFLPYSHFSVSFIQAAVTSDDLDPESPSLLVSSGTIYSWKKLELPCHSAPPGTTP